MAVSYRSCFIIITISKMKNVILLLLFFFTRIVSIGQASIHDLQFDSLATQWDEAIPLGNGMLGALVWQKGARLRFSLDRADLWDARPMRGLHRNEFSYAWVTAQVMKKDYAPVQRYFDAPYDNEPAPSKIPGGAVEFDTKSWGAVQSVRLFLQTATCEVRWANGTVLKTYVHATAPIGWFRFQNVKGAFVPQLIAPRYQGAVRNIGDPVSGDDLARLGYAQGSIKQQGNSITYNQTGWGGFSYEISVHWKQIDATTVEGVWSISSHSSPKATNQRAAATTQHALAQHKQYPATHVAWWKAFWNKSSLQVPDPMLEKQWYLEQYKFGSAARKGAPMISLQAVWTADNGRIPPWKGDYHHDLNTQLSYWPAYSANHLEESMAYLDHLDGNKKNYKRYTKAYFGKEGLAVPGVTTLDGTEMGGWIQYSFSPTIACWLAQHYYLQWRYNMDRKFLAQRAYPWLKETALFIEKITVKDSNGYRELPISSSPEINNNDLSAWFLSTTNYDLSLIKFALGKAAELAAELGLAGEAARWKKIASEFRDFALSERRELLVAPGVPYTESHRHFSNLMAIHPLGLIKWEDGETAKTIIKNSIHLTDSIGPDWWCGYSYAWLANLKARAKDGAGAAAALTTFATAFCSSNSFHLNGDQTKSGLSKFQYRPFTLEGNFAFAAGLQEMLLQSYSGVIEILPALPDDWKDIAFVNLRAEGAFLISATQKDGLLDEVKLVSEKGGRARLKTGFKTWYLALKKDAVIEKSENGIIEIWCKPGAIVVLKNGYE